MYKRATYRIRSNEPLTETVYRMVVEGDTQYLTAPGQFVNIELPGRFLRRPISVCDYDGHTITLIYKVIGEGTAQMAGMAAGGELDMLTGLGNGFSTAVKTERPLLVGGGVGVPPLYNLAKRLLAEGRRVSVVLGFNTASEVFYAEEFEALGVDVTVATADGSRGMRGFVTDVPAAPCRCSVRCRGPFGCRGSSASRSGWDAVSPAAWDAPAIRVTATSVSARRARC